MDVWEEIYTFAIQETQLVMVWWNECVIFINVVVLDRENQRIEGNRVLCAYLVFVIL